MANKQLLPSPWCIQMVVRIYVHTYLLRNYVEHLIFIPLLIHNYTVEPPIKDPPKKGQCIKYLSTKDTSFVPKIHFPYKLYIGKPPKEDNLSTKDKTCRIYIGPKVSFVRRFHCISFHTNTITKHSMNL